MTTKRTILLLVLFALALTLLSAAAENSGYKVLNTYQIGGEGGWDYLTFDKANHRLYIARENRALIVDTESGKLVGELADTPGIHGVALIPKLHRAVTSNGKANSATVFDLNTMKAIGEVKTGEKPDAIIYDSASKLVFVMNGQSNSATAIDPQTLQVAGTVPLAGNPEFGVSDGLGTVFVNLESAGAIAAIDSRKLSVKSVWPMDGCEEPTGLALDKKNHRLFSVCHNQKMVVVNSDSGKVVATLPIGANVDAAAYDPETQTVFSSNGDGTLTVVHEDSPDQFHVVDTVRTQPGAKTMALDTSAHRVYLAAAKYGEAPAPTAATPRPRRPMIPGSFSVLVVGQESAAAPAKPAELHPKLNSPFRFVAFGDTRFTNPADTKAANPEVRQALVKAIAEAQPAFISLGGDIAYDGNVADDWKVYDRETAIWRERGIPVYPALGNHDLHGDLKVCLENYFQRYPELAQSRYYSVRTANMLLLTLDSSLDELAGPQGDWLKAQLDGVDDKVDFVFIVLHHPPYTSSSDEGKYGGGHSQRPKEQDLAKFLEERQQRMRARLVVFAGHVHNYERHEHGGVLYFVTGGGGAHAYPIERAAADPFQSKSVNYHYLLVEVDGRKLNVTMKRLDLKDGKQQWGDADTVKLVAPNAEQAAAAR